MDGILSADQRDRRREALVIRIYLTFLFLFLTEHNSFDNDPWILKLVDFTKKILETQSRIRVLGICFGHQIVGRALGAKVARGNLGWEVSVTPLELTSVGKEVFGVETLVSSVLLLRHLPCPFLPQCQKVSAKKVC